VGAAAVAYALARGDSVLKVWCAGSASGEEPYTIAVLWRLRLQPGFPDLHLHVLASDIDPVLQRRARLAFYPYSAVKKSQKLRVFRKSG
jgi:chemotaxis protein methyltransferase CheR